MIGILNSSSALLKWAVAGSVIADILVESESEIQIKRTIPHHEDNDRFEETFKKDKKNFSAAFLEVGNPFELTV